MLHATDIPSLIGPTLAQSERDVRAVAINALFGAFGRGGTSGPLGNDTDASLIAGLRDWADVILVGAGTVTAEDYGPADTPLAVLSTSLKLDTGLGIFNSPRLLILTPKHSLIDASFEPHRSTLTAKGAELISTGSGSITEAVEALHDLGFNRILCEGGPSVYAAAISADLIDVLHLTVDPSTSASDDTHGLEITGEGVHRFQLEHVGVDDDSMMFCRYRRVPAQDRA